MTPRSKHLKKRWRIQCAIEQVERLGMNYFYIPGEPPKDWIGKAWWTEGMITPWHAFNGNHGDQRLWKWHQNITVMFVMKRTLKECYPHDLLDDIKYKSNPFVEMVKGL